MPRKKKQVLSFPFATHTLIQKEDDQYIATCLEFSLAAQADSIESVKQEMDLIIKEYVEYMVTHNMLEKIFKPSRKELWDLWLEASKQGFDRHRILLTKGSIQKDLGETYIAFLEAA
jgi:predicted RNase H-like HicB family nuclease